MGKRPHIIIFNPDEMRADALAHLGNRAAVTPNIDRLVKEDAVSFSNAYCQNPVCVPSRCSFFTGLYPHVHGHRTMSYLLRPGETSLLGELRESGYYVWMNDRNDLCAGQYEGWADSQADEVFYGSGSEAPLPENPEHRGAFGGRDYYSHLEGRLVPGSSGVCRSKDDEAVDAAIERLLNPVDDKPICVFLGLMYPHVPYGVEDPFYSCINRDLVPPIIMPEECSEKAKILSLIRQNQGMETYSDKEWAELRAVYLGMCMKIDAQLGRLTAALKNAGIYDDCAIFFFSDHGDYTGDYGIVEKAQNSFEDCLTRVPLIIKPPADEHAKVGVRDSLVELVDFYATALDYAKLSSSHTHFGKSLRPVLTDPGLSVREEVYCEGGRMPNEIHCDEYHQSNGSVTGCKNVYWPRMKAQEDASAHIKGIMLRTKDFKYISRADGSDELYDLNTDPGERTNIINNTKYCEALNILRLRMLRWLQATDDVVPLDADERFTPEMLWARARGIVAPSYEPQVKDMIARRVSFVDIMQFCREHTKERETTMISEQAKALHEWFKKRNASNEGISLEQFRERQKARFAAIELPEGVKTEWTELGGVPVELMTVPGASAEKVLLYIHGGGFTNGSVLNGRNYCSGLAALTGRTVYAVEYRLAPENPYPAGLNDCIAVYKAMLAGGISAENIVITGESAGGNLTLALTLWLKDNKIALPTCIAVHSPGVGFDIEVPDELYERDVVLKKDSMGHLRKIYIGDSDISCPYLSPIKGDFSGFPPTFIQVADAEILYPHSVLLAQRLDEAKVEHELKVAKDMHHAFVISAVPLPEAEQSIRDTAEFINSHCSH